MVYESLILLPFILSIEKNIHTYSTVRIEYTSDPAIEAREDHAVRYRLSPDLGAHDRLESCEHCVEDVHSGTSRRR